MHSDRARLAISLVDLTDLTDGCTAQSIDTLCDRASEYGTAAVCVWPDFVARAHHRLVDTGVRVATVVNFPTGDERAYAVGVVTRDALDAGADEIDVVLPYRWLKSDPARVSDMLSEVRQATAERALMKVILETGELVDPSLITEAAQVAISHGADFIKTSTGKTPISATVEAARLMLGVIAESDRPVGIKPSGGISTADDAEQYLALAESVMGEGWLSPETFRFGASGVLNALIAVVNGAAATTAAPGTY